MVPRFGLWREMTEIHRCKGKLKIEGRQLAASITPSAVQMFLAHQLLIHLLEDFSPLPSSPKWLCQNGGNRPYLLYFSYILTFDIYTFFQFYISSRFVASLLCLIKCWSWLSQAIVTSKPNNQAALFDWREEICLTSGREILTTSSSHLGCISRVSSIAFLDVINSQVEGEHVLISSSLSPDEVWWVTDKCQYPLTNMHRLEVKVSKCSPCAQSGMFELSCRLALQPLTSMQGRASRPLKISQTH